MKSPKIDDFYDPLITADMLHADDQARIAELEEMLAWACEQLRAYQIVGTADITRLLAKGKI